MKNGLVSQFFVCYKKASHLSQELVLGSKKIQPFLPQSNCRIKKGETKEKASYFLLSARKSSLLRKITRHVLSLHEHVFVAHNNFPPFPPNPVSSCYLCNDRDSRPSRTTGYLLGFPATPFLGTVLQALRKLMCRGENHQYQAYVLRLKTY